MKIGDWVFVKEIHNANVGRTRKVGDIYKIGYSRGNRIVNKDKFSILHYPDSETPGCYEFELILATKNVLRFYGFSEKSHGKTKLV